MDYDIETRETWPPDTIDVPDEADIIDGEWRGGNRFILTIAIPQDGTFECNAPTDGDGTCSIEVDGPDERCHIHG